MIQFVNAKHPNFKQWKMMIQSVSVEKHNVKQAVKQDSTLKSKIAPKLDSRSFTQIMIFCVPPAKYLRSPRDTRTPGWEPLKWNNIEHEVNTFESFLYRPLPICTGAWTCWARRTLTSRVISLKFSIVTSFTHSRRIRWEKTRWIRLLKLCYCDDCKFVWLVH